MNQLIAVIFFLLASQVIPAQHRLEIEIEAIRNNKGKIMLQVFDEQQNILFQDKAPINDTKCHFSFKNLRSGKYAVRYYHDENLNGEMETNLAGKPVEGYGFSNNVTRRFAPPPFESWLFILDQDKKIVLKPTY